MRWLLTPFKGLAWLVAKSPWCLQKSLGIGLGIFWFDILRVRRRVVVDNLAIAFPKLSHSDRVKLGRQSMIEFCTNLVQYTYLPFLDQNSLHTHFVVEGVENFDKARARGRGVLLLTLHLGNGDVAMAALGLLGKPIHLISKMIKTQWLNDLWFGLRARHGVKFIAPRNSSYAVLKSLKRNECVIFVQDQFAGPPIGIRSHFFGRETGTGVGLATMAERSGGAVVPSYNLRLPDGRLRVVFEPEIEFIHGNDREQALALMTQVYNDRLEQYVRMCPEQWMWLHKRWKKFKY